MRVLGFVEWTNRDKKSSAPIAGVRPLVELQKDGWREINAAEEFPSQGLIFWPDAQAATKDALVVVRVGSNTGQKDEYKVDDHEPVFEVLDLREYGTATDVRARLVDGIRSGHAVGTIKVMIWCKPDVLIGPVTLKRLATGNARLDHKDPVRLPMYSETQIRPLRVDGTDRLVRFSDSGRLSGYVDWDDDEPVLRRALGAAVSVASAGPSTGLTKKQIEEAAHVLVSKGGGPDLQLNQYRLERALTLIGNVEAVTKNAAELVERLRAHPAIKLSLDELAAKVRADVEQSARAELEQSLSRERTALKETSEARAKAKLETEAIDQELRKVERQLAEARSQVASAVQEAETTVNARVAVALERPAELLAEISVLRPFLRGAAGQADGLANPAPTRIDWSRSRGEDVKDKASLRRILTNAARGRGVEPSLMFQLHAAVVARLMPITLGPSALAALTAYAQGACGGRLLVVHVSPGAIHPHDFDQLPTGGLLAAASAAKDVNGLSIVVLEGANRAPLEATVVPLLQRAEVGLSPLSTVSGLRLAASFVAGVTTVPVTPQVWSHAAAIYPAPNLPSGEGGASGDLVLTSDLLVPGDPPTNLVDALLETWPDCVELRPSLSRYGSALIRLYDEESRISEALLHGLILPFVATALDAEEQTAALESARDADGALAKLLQRLRRRLT